MKRIISNLKEDKPSIGMLVRGTPIVGQKMAALGQAGLDFVIIDMMFATLSWEDVYVQVLAARQAGMTPIVRIDAYPWGTAEPDRRLVVHASHAFSLGAGGVCASVCSAKEVEQMATVLDDWHRMEGFVTTPAELKVRQSMVKGSCGLFPLIESIEALDDIDKIMDVKGVTAVFIACTDLARQVGHPLDPEHPDVWKIIDDVVKKGRKKNVAVMGNTSFPFKTVEANAQRIKNFHDHGVRIILLQTDSFLMYWATKSVLDGFHKLLP